VARFRQRFAASSRTIIGLKAPGIEIRPIDADGKPVKP
jgi:hypothetical protein